MRGALVASVATLVLACGNKKDAPPATGSAGSATGSAGSATGSAGSTTTSVGSGGDPWSGSGGGSGSESCNDDEIRRRVDAGLSQSLAYLGALEKRTARWKTDCEAAKQDLLALEPDAKRFMDAMTEFTSWGRTLSADCRDRIGEIGEQHPTTADLDKRTPAIEARVTPMLERCKDHPGFQDAAAKGLRVLRTKKKS